MPMLDVSSVLLDPMFVDRSLVCTRNKQTVGDNGLAVNTPTNIPFHGVVTSGDGDVLRREPEGERVEGTITIHTRFRLTTGKNDLIADTVTWRGRQYVVSLVNDYSNFGRGFIAATCDLIPLSGGK